MINKKFAYAGIALLLFVVGLGAVALARTQDPNKEELKLQLPKPMFIGTPRNIKTPNLEAITGKPRGPFYVPKGTALLSLKKPVTSSDMQPVIGELNFITDGEKTGEDGYFVELGPENNGSRSTSRLNTLSRPSSSGTTTARPGSIATSSSRSPMTRTSSPGS